MVKAMRDVSSEIIMDIHLCVERPARYVETLAKAGANSIIFQFEAVKNSDEALELAKLIQDYGMESGISINPSTPIKDIEILLESKLFDIIDILAVEPGFGGQKFQESTISKLQELHQAKARQKITIKTMVDGGMNEITSKLVISVGADILVVGTYLFGHKSGMSEAKHLLLDNKL